MVSGQRITFLEPFETVNEFTYIYMSSTYFYIYLFSFCWVSFLPFPDAPVDGRLGICNLLTKTITRSFASRRWTFSVTWMISFGWAELKRAWPSLLPYCIIVSRCQARASTPSSSYSKAKNPSVASCLPRTAKEMAPRLRLSFKDPRPIKPRIPRPRKYKKSWLIIDQVLIGWDVWNTMFDAFFPGLYPLNQKSFWMVFSVNCRTEWF